MLALWGRVRVRAARTPRWNAHAPARVQQARESLSIEQTQPGEITESSGGPETGRGLPRIAPRRMEIGSPTNFPLPFHSVEGCRLSAILRPVLHGISFSDGKIRDR